MTDWIKINRTTVIPRKEWIGFDHESRTDVYDYNYYCKAIAIDGREFLYRRSSLTRENMEHYAEEFMRDGGWIHPRNWIEEVPRNLAEDWSI